MGDAPRASAGLAFELSVWAIPGSLAVLVGCWLRGKNAPARS